MRVGVGVLADKVWLGEGQGRVLADRIGGGKRMRQQSGGRHGLQKAALPTREHAGQQGPRDLYRRDHVELGHRAFAVRRVLHDRPEVSDAGIVDQKIDRLAFGKADHRLVREVDQHEAHAQQHDDPGARSPPSNGIPAAPVRTIPEVAKDPHLWEREMLVKSKDPVAGEMYLPGATVKLSKTPARVGPVPTPGQHTDEVLSGLLGYDRAALDALRKAGAIA